MNTVCIQIGNSDNRLTQQTWSQFCAALRAAVLEYGEIHFSGGPSTDEPHQNYCVVAGVHHHLIGFLTGRLKELKPEYMQQSIALLAGNVEII